jgi:hypothetical protein
VLCHGGAGLIDRRRCKSPHSGHISSAEEAEKRRIAEARVKELEQRIDELEGCLEGQSTSTCKRLGYLRLAFRDVM